MISNNCYASDTKGFKHNSKVNGLKNKLQTSSKGHVDQNIVAEKAKSFKATSSFFVKAKTRAKAMKKGFVDKNSEKRDNFVTIPEPFPVNRFVQEPYLDRHVNYVPQPYPVSHVEYVAKPIAVPVEVPNQVKVQHFHIHKDRK